MAKSGDSPREARDAALQGVWVGVLLAISNGIAAGMFFLLSPALSKTPVLWLLASLAAMVCTPLALAWCVRRWQPRWAALALLLWTGGALAEDLRLLLVAHTLPAGLIFVAFAFLGSIQAVRGAFRLAALGRNVPGGDPAKVF